MDDAMATTASRASRFELAPPRRFILPAILLLLSERPGYGYGLLPCLEEFRFGHVDRPAVYRALIQLEQDGLVEASSQSPTAGQARRLYRVTPLGERVLRVWMGVVKEEHDHLGQVLRRYQATGTTDAVLAEVEGGWSAALGSSWSAVSSTSAARRRLMPVAPDTMASLAQLGECAAAAGADADRAEVALPRRFRLLPDRSVVLIEVRSTVGPLTFGAIGVSGSVEAAIVDGVPSADESARAHLEIDVARLSSGNNLYDAELHRRIDARRFPTATVELCECAQSGPGSRYRLEGEVTFHGVTRVAQGSVTVEAASDRRLVITGEQVLDIRDFEIPSPTVLMFRIYPDVRVRLHVEADQDEADLDAFHPDEIRRLEVDMEESP